MVKKRVRSSKRKATKKKASKKKPARKASKKKATKRKSTKKKTSKKKVSKKKVTKKKSTKKRSVKKKPAKKKATKKKTKKKATKKRTTKKKTTRKKSTSRTLLKEKTVVVERPESTQEPIPHIENIDIQPLFDASKEYDSEIKSSAEAVVNEEQKRSYVEDDPVAHELHGSVHQKPNEVTVYNENRLSGTAVSAFVFAFLIPPVGIILGLIAKHIISRNSRLRGDRLALAAFLIGLIFSIVWAISLVLLY